jgi:hypothetical protein
MLSPFLYCLFCFLAVSNAVTLLELVGSDPQLSNLATIIAGTGGGPGGLPNPGLLVPSPLGKGRLTHR